MSHFILFQLLHKRGNVCTLEEQAKWKEVPSEAMSDEEEVVDGSSTIWLVRSPVWRSQLLNERIHNLDQRLARGPQQLCNRRRPGPHSTRLPTSRVPQELIDSAFHSS